MLQVKIGIQLASLRLPFRRAVQVAAELGAQAVEVDARGELQAHARSRTATRHIRRLLEDHQLRVCAVSFRTRRGYNVAADLDARMDGTRHALQLAYALGAPVVVNAVGQVPPESQGAEWDLLIQALTEIGTISLKAGAVLAADTGSESGADLARLLAALPDGSIGVNFSPGQLIVNGFSPVEALSALGARILHVHAQDAVRDRSAGRGLQVPLGSGSADFPDLLARLEENQYRGYFTVAAGPTTNPRLEVQHAVHYLRTLS